MNYELVSPFRGITLRPYEILNDDPEIAGILLDSRTWSKGFGDSSSRIPQDMSDAMKLASERREDVSLFSILEINSQSRVIGSTGIISWNYETETVKIGRTILNPDCWGMKYNHEVKLVLLDWLFESNVGRVECDVAPSNANSIRSLERFGFTYEGVKRRAVRRSDGTWRDTIIFSLIVDEWEMKRKTVVDKIMERNEHNFLL